jgi:hypothetical protein
LAKSDYTLQAEKIYLENKVVEAKKKYELSKKEYFQQSKNCKFIKINLEEMIEKQAAFHNTLLILNNEMIDLSILISKEKEKVKKGLKIDININKNNKISMNNNLTVLNNKDEKKGK